MARTPLDEAQQAIGYAFHSPRLLDEALTHTSYVNEIKDPDSKDNERLEFLGDAVLALVISEQVAAASPDLTEGALSKLRSRLVSEATLARVARRLDLGKLLRLGRGEERTRGRDKESILANTLEAVLAAVYRDGGLDAARSFVLKAFAQDLREAADRDAVDASSGDYKTQLQEWCQQRYDSVPRYVTAKESGPDHQKTFDVQVLVQGRAWGRGTGRSKKEAEQAAAQEAMERVKREK
ncbi:MAG TPA: ribonuclease III [Nitrospiraceae bacterium]|nr:ribonuclease III [Nitrospiraceae bacterium]